MTAKKAIKPPKAIIEIDVEGKERQQALTEYEKHMDEVNATKVMTDTAAWQKFYRKVMADIETHGQEVLTAEKTRDIVCHQEGVKILKAMVAGVSRPVHELDRFIASMPLFVQSMKIRATWNKALGKVELKAMDGAAKP